MPGSAIVRRLRLARRKIAIVAIVLVAVAGLLVLVVAYLRQRSQIAAWESASPSHREGTLSARPHAPTHASTTTGMSTLDMGGCALGALGHELEIVGCRDGFVYVPAHEGPLGLLVVLHGGFGAPDRMVTRFVDEADRRGLVLLAPASRASSWDVVRGGFGPDVAFLDRALARIFDGHAIDPDRIAVVGFSDGATQALSLGLANGDLFREVIALSPGAVQGGPRPGTPRVFVSHGRQDDVLPIDESSRAIVPALQASGLDVTYVETDGDHSLTDERLAEALAWSRLRATIPAAAGPARRRRGSAARRRRTRSCPAA